MIEPHESREATHVGEAAEFDDTLAPGDPRFESVLDERARELARRTARVDSAIASATHIRFDAGGIAFAVESESVVRVLHAPKVTRIPGAPRNLERVLHVDGRITSVIDPAAFVDAGADTVVRCSVLLVESGARRIGLFADQVAGLHRVRATELEALRDHHAAGSFVIGTSADMVVLLDAAAIVANAARASGLAPLTAR